MTRPVTAMRRAGDLEPPAADLVRVEDVLVALAEALVASITIVRLWTLSQARPCMGESIGGTGWHQARVVCGSSLLRICWVSRRYSKRSTPASTGGRAARIAGLPKASAELALPTSCPHQNRECPSGAMGTNLYNRRSERVFTILHGGQISPSRFRFNV